MGASGEVRGQMNTIGMQMLEDAEPCESDAFEGQMAVEDGLSSNITTTAVQIPKISQICVVNNAGFDVQWRMRNCPARTETIETSPYPLDHTQCMNVQYAFGKELKSGDVLRLGVHAKLGMRFIADPPVRYVEDAGMSAGFVCSGGNLYYNCELVSVAPTHEGAVPSAKTICILNQAYFTMDWFTVNNRSHHQSQKTSTYPINHMRCMDLGSTGSDVQDGDLFQVQTHAVLGKTLPTDRQVKYSVESNEKVAFVCRGTTLKYSCKLLTQGTSLVVPGAAEKTQVVV